MLDKARLTIIASVPLTMTFNLFLLNHFYNPRVESNNIKTSVNTISRDDFIEREKKEYKRKKIVYESKKSNKSIHLREYEDMIFKFSPPAPHTFIVNDSLTNRMEERQAMRNQGKIIK